MYNKYKSEFKVNTNTNSHHQTIASLSDGGFVIAWTSEESIWVQMYDSDVEKKGSEFKVNTQTQGNQESATIASLSDGGFVIAWTSDDAEDRCVYAQMYKAESPTILSLKTEIKSLKKCLDLIKNKLTS